MQAKSVAIKLQELNINVLNFIEGDDLEDGLVAITNNIHVQVPTYGRGINVVHELDDETFQFYPIRKSFDDVIADINKALA